MPLTDAAFEKLVANLQEQSFADAKDAYGDRGFERWRTPRFNVPLPHADCSALLHGSCGDAIEISLKFTSGRVADAAYRTNGCASSALCGSFTAELCIGKNVDELLRITPEDVLQCIGRFPREDRHCATLAVNALRQAVRQHLQETDGSPAGQAQPLPQDVNNQ